MGFLFRRRPHAAMPARFMPLARYNTRVSEGIVHTGEYAGRMRALQREYDTWASLALVPPHRLLYAAASVVDVVTAMVIAQTIGSVRR